MEDLPDRSASAAIAGYQYQFDLTVLKIIETSTGKLVTVEGVEDIDVSDLISGKLEDAVQCKYLDAKKYSLANIRSAVLPMIEAYSRGHAIKYHLYSYFGGVSGPIPSRLSVQELKECLTEEKRNPKHTLRHHEKYDQDTLHGFAESFSIHKGMERNKLREAVVDALVSAMRCSKQEAEFLHYGNARSCVADIAMRKLAVERKITRSEFLSMLDKKPLLYSIWHREHASIDKFLKAMSSRLKKTKALANTKRRAVIVESPLRSVDPDSMSVQHMIDYLAKEAFGRGKLRTAKPWTVVIEGTRAEVLGIKRSMLKSGICFMDGYEEIDFSPSMFDKDPIVLRQFSGNRIETSSYDLRVIGRNSLEKYCSHGYRFDTVVSICDVDPSVFGDESRAIHIANIDIDQFIHLISE